MATRTGVRRAAWFHLAGADAQQMAFVREHAPQFAAHLRIGAPVAEAPAHTASASFRFERGEIFSAHQMTVIQQRQQNQQITGQMRQFSISTLIRFPTRGDALLVALDTVLPSSEMDRKGYSLLVVRGGGSGDQLFVALCAGFEAINLSTQPRLSAIKPSAIQKHRARELREGSLRLLAEIFGQCENRGGDARPHAPVPSQHAALLGKLRHEAGRDFQDQIEHGGPASIIAHDFPQGRGLRKGSLIQIAVHRFWERDRLTPGSPSPRVLLVGPPQPQGKGRLVVLFSAGELTKRRKIDSGALRLSEFHALIPRTGEVAHREDRRLLHLFLHAWKRFRLQIRVARLFEQIRHRHEGIHFLPNR